VFHALLNNSYGGSFFMVNPVVLEESYNEFMKDLTKWIPDGVIDVNLKLLDEMGLLTENELANDESQDHFPHYFHVVFPLFFLPSRRPFPGLGSAHPLLSL
jgi:hypothetical protein